MKTKIYFSLLSILVFGNALSQTKLLDTSAFNHSYWNGIANKKKYSPSERAEFIEGNKQKVIRENSSDGHSHGSPDKLIWVEHPSQKGYSGGSTFAGPCTNIDFENGTLTGWVRSTGFNPQFSVTGCCPNPNGDQTIMSGTGVDPYGNFPVVYPGGNFSLRLGSTAIGGIADRISQTFFVTQANANFTYRYAAVLNNGGHNQTDQPRFTIEMIDSVGNAIPCTFYNVVAGSNIPGFVTSTLIANTNPTTTVSYKPWTSVAIDLTPNIGQNVTLRFTVYDCGPSGHFAYAYIDGLCTNFQTSVADTTCLNVPYQMCGPDGFATYRWNGPGVTNNPNKCISVSTPGIYVCTTTLVPGCPGPSFTHTLSNYAIPGLTVTPTAGSCSPTYSFAGSFTIAAGSIVSYSYAFGDNTSTIGQNVTHTYPTTPAAYTVTFSATTNRGCVHSTTNTAIVYPYPIIAFSPPSHCLNTLVQFTNTSGVPPVVGVPPGSVSSYTWNFGNSAMSNLQNPTSTYTSSGTFTVTLAVTSDQGCITTGSQTLGIFPAPTLSFVANPLCDQNGTAFSPLVTSTISSGNIVSYFWNFGDGGTSTLQNPNHIYSGPNTYTVSYTGTSNHNCVQTVTQSLLISPTPTVAFSTFSLNACSPQFTFNSNTQGATSHNWSFIGPNGTGTSTLSNPNYTFPAVGSYTVRLIAISGMGCADTLMQNITLYPFPVVSVSVPASCESAIFTATATAPTGSITSFNWNFGDPLSGPSNTSTLQNPTHSYGSVGLYTISLNVISNQNCPSTYTSQINVHPNPVPGFNFFPPDACTSTFTFVNNSGWNPNPPPPNNSLSSYLWNLNGTNTSTLFAPTHTFPGPGTYTVTLTAKSNNNCTASTSRTLAIHPYPQVTLNVLPSCLNVAASFSGNFGTSVVTHTYNFGDGTFDNVNINPTHPYLTSKFYTVSLSVTSNEGCISTKTTNLQIFPLPSLVFNFNSACVGSPVSFTNLSTMPNGYSITGYKWDFNADGITDDIFPNPAFTYTAPGTFAVELFAKTNNNCIDSTTKNIIVHDVPSPVISMPNVCFGQSSAYSASLSLPGSGSMMMTHSWNFGDNSSPGNTQGGQHLYGAAGVYTVQLTATNNNNCAATVNTIVTVYQMPVLNFSANPVCFNSITTFTNLSTIGNPDQIIKWKWDYGNGWADSIQDPLKAFAAAGNYVVKLFGLSNNQCSSTITRNIKVYDNPKAHFTSSTVCVGDNITIVNLSSTLDGTITSHGWDFDGDNSVDQETVTPNFAYSMNGNYLVRLLVTTNYGCKNSMIKQIYANPKPVPVMSTDVKSGCPGLCIQFKSLSYINGGDARNFTTKWDFGDGGPINTIANPTRCFGEGSFDIKLELRSDSGCRSSLISPGYVNIFPDPVAAFSVEPPEVDEDEPQIQVFSNASSDAIYTRYYMSDGASFGTENFSHSIKNLDSKLKPMIVQIVKNQHGCTDTLYKVLDIKPAFAVYVPNVFTPNGDGNNDKFMAKGVGIMKFAMQIYDRWGHLVWNTDDMENAWDGTSKGTFEPIKQDTYTWKAQVTDIHNKNHNLVGHVSLIK